MARNPAKYHLFAMDQWFEFVEDLDSGFSKLVYLSDLRIEMESEWMIIFWGVTCSN